MLSNRDCCEGSCVHQELSGLGLRRGDLHHVACWIRSSSSGDILRVIGRLLSGRLAVKDRDKTPRIIGVILIILVSDYWVYHGECFLLIADLRIVLPRAVYRSYWLQICFD
jgi:hypothetical protein